MHLKNFKTGYLIPLFLSLSLSLSLASLHAQEDPGKVYEIHSDRLGCIWLGAETGLFRVCSGEKGMSQVIKQIPGVINELHESPFSGNPEVWVGTTEGIFRYTYGDDGITGVKSFKLEFPGFTNPDIKAIKTNSDGTMFFAAPEGIGRFHEGKWSFEVDIMDIFENNFTAIEISRGTVFLGTWGEGVARLVQEVDAYSGASVLSAPWSQLTGNNITVIFADSKGRRWYGSDAGLARHSAEESKEGWDDSFTKKLPHSFVTAVAEDASGNIWVGTQGGLVCFAEDKSVVGTWTQAEGLPSARVNDLCFDLEGKLWIATDGGVVRFDGKNFGPSVIVSSSVKVVSFKKLLKKSK